MVALLAKAWTVLMAAQFPAVRDGAAKEIRPLTLSSAQTNVNLLSTHYGFI